MCHSFGELITVMLYELKGIQISGNDVARTISVSPNSIVTWKKDARTYTEMIEDRGNFSRSKKLSILRIGENAFTYSLKKKRWNGNEWDEVKIPQNIARKIKWHHSAFLSGDDSCSLKTELPHRQSGTARHCELATLELQLQLWKDPAKDSQPFGQYEKYRRQVKVFDVGKWSCRYIFDGSDDAIIRTQVASSGTIDEIRVNDPFLQHQRTPATLDITKGASMPLTFRLESGRSLINYDVFVYNGFRPGYEDVSLKILDFDTRRAEIRLDFRSVLMNSGIEFAIEPKAEYILAGDVNGIEIPVRSEQNSLLWRASYDHPAAESRLKMSWSLRQQ